MKNGWKWSEQKWVPYTIATVSAVLVYLFFSHLNGITQLLGSLMRVLEPIIIGLVIAYLVSPFIHFLERKVFFKIHHERARYTLSMIVALVTILVLIGVLMSILIPQIVSSVIQFIANINYYSDKLSALFRRIAERAKRIYRRA